MSKVVLVVAVGVAMRLALFSLPWLPRALDARVECSTPVTSFKRLEEGLYHFQHGVSPYTGGIFHQSPLLVAFFSILADSGAWNTTVNVVYAIVDGATALALAKVASGSILPAAYPSLQPEVVAAVFLLNPFTLLSTIARSTSVLTNALVAQAILAASNRRIKNSLIVLALASVLSFYPIYLAPVVIGMGASTSSRPRYAVGYLTVLFVALIGGFLWLSYTVAGSWSFLESTYGSVVFFSELTPNIGLWWYFFVEMFDFFRPFFTGVFQLYLAAFSIPFAVRFQNYPLYAFAAIAGLTALFKSYPETGDYGLFLSLLALGRPVFALLKYPLPVTLVIAYASFLAPTFYHLWIDLGSGNSNFFYATNLVASVGMVLLLADTTWAVLRLEHDGGKNTALGQI